MKKTIITLVILITSMLFTFSQKKEEVKVKIDTVGTITDRFIIKNVGINNPFQNFGTTFFGANKVIYSSQKKENGYLDLYVGTMTKEGEITNQTIIDGVNSKYHQSNVVFTNNQKTVYFTRSLVGKTNTVKVRKNKKARIAIFKADVTTAGKWKNAKRITFNNGDYDIGHPSINKAGTKMYFTSNMIGTYGKTDIFVVDIKADGTFSTPKNMGPKVNSKHREMFPHIDENNILYFSSNRPDGGHGGLDIYAIKIYENGDISDKIHLDPPINSIADDFAYIYDKDKKAGFYSSNRKRGKGSDDIYFFDETRPLVFDCFQDITGIVIDNRSRAPIPFAVVTLFDAQGEIIKKIKTEKDGKFKFEQVTCDTQFEVLGEKEYYTKNLKRFITKALHNGETDITVTLEDSFIVKRRGKQMLNINVINFDFDSDKIRPDAAYQLDGVVRTMNKYPRMIIDMGSHTDSRGGDKYNFKLSDKRAASVISYIVSHGITGDRIQGKGYGETKLINKCSNGVKCTEREHEQNRRSEFIITRM